MAANKKLVSTEVGRIAKDLGRGLSSIDWRGMARSVLSLGHGIGKLVDFVGGPRNALIGLAVVMNAQTIMALGGLVVAVGRAGIALLGMAARAYVASNAALAVGRAGIALLGMAARAYVASNAALLAVDAAHGAGRITVGHRSVSALALGLDTTDHHSMLRMGLGASQLVTGPLALLRSGWTLLTTTTVSMSGLMSSAFAMVAGGIRAVGAAMMANPLGIILAIASAAWLIVENWDTLKSWFNSFWSWIKAHGELILTHLPRSDWLDRQHDHPALGADQDVVRRFRPLVVGQTELDGRCGQVRRSCLRNRCRGRDIGGPRAQPSFPRHAFFVADLARCRRTALFVGESSRRHQSGGPGQHQDRWSARPPAHASSRSVAAPCRSMSMPVTARMRC
ncbi:hypothetical protein [Xanthomonas sp. MUS 060]|uniref:hypothetical protein n=1 Tax=Xanthomonas sp. MUS 060 TaxID=1588031 RepID=UPI0005F28223|nr:hypothetical protein [Xanthomonas sp. MUS 060]